MRGVPFVHFNFFYIVNCVSIAVAVRKKKKIKRIKLKWKENSTSKNFKTARVFES